MVGLNESRRNPTSLNHHNINPIVITIPSYSFFLSLLFYSYSST